MAEELSAEKEEHEEDGERRQEGRQAQAERGLAEDPGEQGIDQNAEGVVVRGHDVDVVLIALPAEFDAVDRFEDIFLLIGEAVAERGRGAERTLRVQRARRRRTGDAVAKALGDACPDQFAVAVDERHFVDLRGRAVFEHGDAHVFIGQAPSLDDRRPVVIGVAFIRRRIVSGIEVGDIDGGTDGAPRRAAVAGDPQLQGVAAPRCPRFGVHRADVDVDGGEGLLLFIGEAVRQTHRPVGLGESDAAARAVERAEHAGAEHEQDERQDREDLRIDGHARQAFPDLARLSSIFMLRIFHHPEKIPFRSLTARKRSRAQLSFYMNTPKK